MMQYDDDGNSDVDGDILKIDADEADDANNDVDDDDGGDANNQWWWWWWRC